MPKGYKWVLALDIVVIGFVMSFVGFFIFHTENNMNFLIMGGLMFLLPFIYAYRARRMFDHALAKRNHYIGMYTALILGLVVGYLTHDHNITMLVGGVVAIVVALGFYWSIRHA